MTGTSYPTSPGLRREEILRITGLLRMTAMYTCYSAAPIDGAVKADLIGAAVHGENQRTGGFKW